MRDNTSALLPAAMSIKDAAAWCGLSRSFLYLQIQAGKLETFRVGSRRLVRPAAIEAMLASVSDATR